MTKFANIIAVAALTSSTSAYTKGKCPFGHGAAKA